MGRPGLDHGESRSDALIDSLVYEGSDVSPPAKTSYVPYVLEIGSGRGIVENLAQSFGLGRSFGLP